MLSDSWLPDGERPALTLDRAELIAEHEGFKDPLRDADGRVHTVVVEFTHGEWWATCETGFGSVATGATRDEVVARARSHGRVVTKYGREIL